MSNEFSFIANAETDTDRFGAALASVLPAGAVIALNGTLGAGKTRLVQAIAKGVGVPSRDVVSPTFVLLHEYPVPAGGLVSMIYHLDTYRLRDEDEFLQLGPEEFYESGGWTIIEWAERVARCLPREYLRLDVELTGTTTRRFHCTAVGERFQPVIAALAAQITE
ncbi:MAG: tRNA (adenosine(37)-N6)-threonylcarbamoyltransferase complex ATPase subunit type 1 TsaE [Planctomycetota bacterium]|nr:tRNA (adenosine(37)-N6)-threonylcarbamoyltransferase complex ATPase subunit type 1 TsaE [Planctomycetota bacterium]